MPRIKEYSLHWSQLLIKIALLAGLALIFSTLLFYNITDQSTGSFFPSLNDSLTVLIITFLLCLELSIPIFSHHKKSKSASPTLPTVTSNISFKAMRPAIFIFLFGIDLTISILPLQMERLYEPLLGLPKEFVIALPIALEFLCVGIALLVSGAWLDRKGWAEPFSIGILLTACGCFYSWLASDAIQFLISRAILGFGYGLTLLAAQGFVIAKTDVKQKAQGLAHLFAGLYSGSICGAATGAIFAERFGYDVVFLGGALITLTVILYGHFNLKLSEEISQRRRTVYAKQNTESEHRIRTILAFLLDRRVIAVSLLSSLPASIAVIGFLHFFTPVYLSQNGVLETEIGQVLMLFGICLTLLGPPIGKMVDRTDNKKIPILIGGLLGCGAFLSFHFNQGVIAATIAVILLGLSNSFVLSSQSAYVLQLDITKKLGEGKSLGIFRAISRLGQMLGPLIFAGLLSMPNTSTGLVWFGIVYLLLVLLFQVVIKTKSSKQHDSGKNDGVVDVVESVVTEITESTIRRKS